jgi:hypothetical protein
LAGRPGALDERHDSPSARSLAVIVLLTCEVIGAVGCAGSGKPPRGRDGGSPGTPADPGGMAGDAAVAPSDGSAAADTGRDASLPGAPEAGAGPDVVAMPPGPCDPAVAHERANRATARWLADFWNGGAQYLEYLEPGTGKLTGYWNFAQAIDLAVDAAERTKERRFGGWPWALILGQEARGWSSDYHDDLNWMALALIRAYKLGGDRRLDARCRAAFVDIKSVHAGKRTTASGRQFRSNAVIWGPRD